MSLFDVIGGQSSAANDNGVDAVNAANQQSFLNALKAQAMGIGPSPASEMLKQQAQQTAAQQYAQAAATRGVNPALALRDAQIQGNAAIQNANQQAGIQRTQEQLGAQQLYGNTVNAARGQDITNGLGNAGLLNSTNLSNAVNAQGAVGSVAGGLGSALESGLGVAGLSALGIFGGGGGKGNGGVPGDSSDIGTATGYMNETGNQYGPQQPSISNGGLMGPPPRAASGGQVTRASVLPPKMAAGGPTPDFFSPQYTQTMGAPTYVEPWLTPDAMRGQGFVEGKDWGNIPGALGPKQWTTSQPGLTTSPLYNPGGVSLASANAAVPQTNQSGTGQPNHVMFASGGGVQSFTPDSNPSDPTGPQSQIGRFLASGATPPAPYAQGGSVKALVSPGERYLNPKAVEQVAEGKKSPMKAGEKIPGKAKVAGPVNSYANDTVPKTLKEGGIVLPRSVTQAKDPAKEAHAFVKALLSRQGGMRK